MLDGDISDPEPLAASAALIQAGAAHAFPETIEGSLRMGSTAFRMLQVFTEEIDQALQNIRDRDYRPVVEPGPVDPPAASVDAP